MNGKRTEAETEEDVERNEEQKEAEDD